VLPLSPQARALLHGPDRRTAWVVVVAATLREPICDVDARLAALGAAVPMTTARLRHGRWHLGSLPSPERVADDPLTQPATWRPFRLAEEAPLRVVVAADARRLALAAHHAAFDGLGLVALLAALLGGPLPAPAAAPPPSRSEPLRAAVGRLLRPADRVAPSPQYGSRDAVAVRAVALDGPRVTARLAAACVAAAGARNARLGSPWQRVGISLGVGGPAGAGNVSTYRRVDLPAGAAVEPAVGAALAHGAPPALAGRLGWLLAPVASRFSDSVLVSNVGRHDLPGAARLDFLPVARGRSAVAFGAAGLTGGTATVTVRARDLGQADAEALLDDVVARLR
jgi:hypothetical protein